MGLGVSGRTAAATRAAGWLRGQQLANAGSCTPYAVKVQRRGRPRRPRLRQRRDRPLDDVENSVGDPGHAPRPLPALLWAPGGAAAGDTKLTGPSGFVPAGSAQTVTLTGAPGDTVCVSSAGTPTRVVLDANGTATVPVTLPATTGTMTVSTADAGGETDSLSFTAWPRAKLGVELRKDTVAKGGKVVVKVSGWPPARPSRVSLGRQRGRGDRERQRQGEGEARRDQGRQGRR